MEMLQVKSAMIKWHESFNLKLTGITNDSEVVINVNQRELRTKVTLFKVSFPLSFQTRNWHKHFTVLV